MPTRKVVEKTKAMDAKDIEVYIQTELAKRESALKDKVRDEVKAENAKAGIQGSKVQIENYQKKSGLVDKDFCARLIGWGVKPTSAVVLRDEHKDLSRDQVWEFIRDNWQNVKRLNKDPR